MGLDPTTTVEGSGGTPYHCPDVASVDGHIQRLLRSIAQCPDRFPKTRQQFRDDVDLLLERRYAMTCLDEVPA